MENCGSAVISVIRFLRGPLINHDTPPTPRLPGRNQIAPVGGPEVGFRTLLLYPPQPPEQASPAGQRPLSAGRPLPAAVRSLCISIGGHRSRLTWRFLTGLYDEPCLA